MNFLLGVATATPLPSPITKATGTAAPLYAHVPLKWFVIMFVVILAGFIGWYVYMRNRGY